MKKIAFLFFAVVVVVIAALATISCPPPAEPEATSTPVATVAPTLAPGATAAPTAGPLVIFGDGAFSAGLTNPTITNTTDSTSISITGGNIVVPASKDVDIRFTAINASAYTKAVITVDVADGGTVAFYSYDSAGATGIKHLSGYGNIFWTTTTTILFADITTVGWDPNSVGFVKSIFDGFGIYSGTQKIISRIELQP
jgi:hypothetical protein